MTQTHRVRGCCILAMLMPLAACSAMLGGGKPDNLYRFGVPEREDVQTAARRTNPITLSLSRVRFAPEIEGDRILTARGDSVLYIKDARWAAPAPDLFTQTLTRQFAGRAPGLRLGSPQERSTQGMVLRIEVDRFEARYAPDGSKDDPPVILVSGIAELVDPANRRVMEASGFSAEETAAANGKAAIVAAFDSAVVRFAADIVDWSSTAVQTPSRAASAGSQ